MSGEVIVLQWEEKLVIEQGNLMLHMQNSKGREEQSKGNICRVCKRVTSGVRMRELICNDGTDMDEDARGTCAKDRGKHECAEKSVCVEKMQRVRAMQERERRSMKHGYVGSVL